MFLVPQLNSANRTLIVGCGEATADETSRHGSLVATLTALASCDRYAKTRSELCAKPEKAVLRMS